MSKPDVFDTSEELLVQRWRNGVRLIRPDDSCKAHREGELSPQSVRDFFAMPFAAYFKSTQHIILNANETTAVRCGCYELKDMIGKSAFHHFKRESAEFVIKHDEAVCFQQAIIVKEEYLMRSDNQLSRNIAIKFPLLDVDEKIIGIFGCTLFQEFLSESFLLLLNTGLLAATSLIENQPNDYPMQLSAAINPQEINALTKIVSAKSIQPISKREVECLFYLIRGKSARETGIALKLSQRTVEFYLDSLKTKLNCKKKSEILEKVVGLLSFT